MSPAVADRDPPPGLNWDMWTGPAPESKYNENYHRCWNHFWRFSGGDIINDGVHQMDLARWVVGKTYPESVYSTGGRYAEKGVLESPDTQVAVFQFEDLVLTFEQTLYTPYMIKSDQALRDSDMFPYWPQNAERIEIYGSKGLMILGRHGCGWQVFDRPKDRKPVIAGRRNGPFPDDVHFENFIQSIRTGSGRTRISRKDIAARSCASLRTSATGSADGSCVVDPEDGNAYRRRGSKPHAQARIPLTVGGSGQGLVHMIGSHQLAQRFVNWPFGDRAYRAWAKLHRHRCRERSRSRSASHSTK